MDTAKFLKNQLDGTSSSHKTGYNLIIICPYYFIFNKQVNNINVFKSTIKKVKNDSTPACHFESLT